MSSTFVLGLNAYHADSAACLLADGALLAAAEEERFRRIKHWAGFPAEAIRYCLSEAGITLGDVQHVAINTNPLAHLPRKLAFALRRRPDLGLIKDRLFNQRKRMQIHQEFETAELGRLKGRLHRVEHHRAHLASAFLVSPFEQAVAVSVDGFGDFASAAWGLGQGNTLSIDGQVFFPHSLGAFYQALTQYLGFPHYGDEYKVMGLAPYGEPAYLDAMRRLVLLQKDGSFRLDLRYFRHVREKVPYAWDGGSPTVGTLFATALEELLGPARRPGEDLSQKHKDIARSAQAMYEEAFFHLLNALHRRYRLPDLAIAGGCGMNSVANGKVTQKTPFQRVYVQAAAGDAGGAIGAAYAVWANLARGAPRFQMRHAYWGPSYADGSIEALLAGASERLAGQNCTASKAKDADALCQGTAQAIADGKVVGWFQGRMEWGPRALGNRSIVCDPRRADMKQILNEKIKRRESFRPFAPSVLREAVPDWFELDGDVPFMMQVYPIRADRRSQIPAVTHVDGSGRLQTVSEKDNPLYYRLIDAFAQLTGVPMVLNTSFNENEPVVCRPEEALDCFLRTRMDLLVLGDWLVERRGG